MARAAEIYSSQKQVMLTPKKVEGDRPFHVVYVDCDFMGKTRAKKNARRIAKAMITPENLDLTGDVPVLFELYANPEKYVSAAMEAGFQPDLVIINDGSYGIEDIAAATVLSHDEAGNRFPVMHLERAVERADAARFDETSDAQTMRVWYSSGDGFLQKTELSTVANAIAGRVYWNKHAN